MKMIYLATPYSAKGDKDLMLHRFKLVTLCAAALMRKGNNVFSPITHSHVIAVEGKLPQLDHEFWLRLDKWYVDRCDEVWVFTQTGWTTSIGVKREIKWALEQGKSVYLCDIHGNIQGQQLEEIQ